MAHSQEASSSMHMEIQVLKQALDVSQKKIDRYAHLIATLFDELDNLRANICYHCKMKLVPCNTSSPPVAATYTASSSGILGSWITPSSASTSISFTGGPIVSAAPPTKSCLSLPVPAVQPGPAVPPILSTMEMTPTTVGLTLATNTGSNEKTTRSRKQNSTLPQWSVVYNPEVKQALHLRIAHVFPYETSVYCVKMSPDGQKVAIGVAHKGKTYINDVKTGSVIRVLVDRYIMQALSIYCVQFSPDGQLLATAASDSRIRIWKIAQGRMLAIFKGHTSRINNVTFSPDGRFLVSASSDLSIRIWNIRDGSSRKSTDDDRSANLSVAFSPDGRYITAGKSDFSLRIYDPRTLKLVVQWGGHTNGVWCAEFTPDGKGLMSGSKDKTLKYWDVSSLRYQGRLGAEAVPGKRVPEIRSFEGHTDAIRRISFFPRNSQNSQWVLTCSDDRSVRLWDLETGVWQLSLQGHTGCVRAVDISRTENMLATASKDHYVTFWKYEVL